MSTSGKTIIQVRGTAVTVLTQPQGDHISLVSLLKPKNGEFAAIEDPPGPDSYRLRAEEWVGQTDPVSLAAAADRTGNSSSKD